MEPFDEVWLRGMGEQACDELGEEVGDLGACGRVVGGAVKETVGGFGAWTENRFGQHEEVGAAGIVELTIGLLRAGKRGEERAFFVSF